MRDIGSDPKCSPLALASMQGQGRAAPAASSRASRVSLVTDSFGERGGEIRDSLRMSARTQPESARFAKV